MSQSSNFTVDIRIRRVPMELQQLKALENSHGISCKTIEKDVYNALEARIPGPKESPYEGGVFSVRVDFGSQYPFQPPTIKFVTPIYHPNIDATGKVCLGCIQLPPSGSYHPSLTLESILMSIQLLLASPNPDDPLRSDAADLLKANRAAFEKKAADQTTLLAKPRDTINVNK